MSTSTDFLDTADSASTLLDCLFQAAQRQGRREQIPSVLELQTICRETGTDLPELNIFARVRDNRPALLLCGGSAEMAMEVARQVGYNLELPELPDAPLVWSADVGSKAGLALRHSDAERAVTPRMLVTFLQSELNLSDFVFVEERVAVESPWRFLWLPRPHYLEKLESSPARLEILLSQQAAVAVMDDTPETVARLLLQLEQKWWSIARDQWKETVPQTKLVTELTSLMTEPEDSRELRAISLWQFLSARLLEELTDRKRSYSQALDQLEHKSKVIRHTLAQYHRNWTNGVRNLTDSFLQQRMIGKAAAELLDPQKPGPDIDSYLAAMGLPGLHKQIEQFVTDRMAEFVAGLDALATRLELRRIPLGEMNTRWNPRTVGPRLESRLREKKIFTDGGGKRSGLVAKMTGKTQGIIDQRKGQMTHACREVVQVISGEFAEWCTGFTTILEQNIRIQLAAALANQGLPDTEGLRAALEGYERLSDRIVHHRDATRTSEDITADWLRLLASRRWIPLYQGH